MRCQRAGGKALLDSDERRVQETDTTTYVRTFILCSTLLAQALAPKKVAEASAGAARVVDGGDPLHGRTVAYTFPVLGRQENGFAIRASPLVSPA
jgi:hypothetical protein